MTIVSFEERYAHHLAFPADSGCWLWLAGTFRDGYGKLGQRKQGKQRTYRAHRMSWEMANGPIPDGALVLHKCDVRSCCNPDHLYLGTVTDNNRDTVKRGRRNPHQHGGSKLTEDDVKRIRSDGRLHREIAQDFGVARNTVGRIKAGVVWAGLLSLLVMVGCAPLPSDGCVWTRPFVPDDGFEQRWTRHEKGQAVAHNWAWQEFCT